MALGLVLGGCGDAPPPAVARVWPAMETMLSAAAWDADTTRLGAALNAARDSVDRVDSLVSHGVRIASLDSVQRDLLQQSGVKTPAESLASGYALDRAGLALAPVSDSALLDLGGQYLWVAPTGRGRQTHRTVGIPDPDNSLATLGVVELRAGSVRTQTQSGQRRGRARSVTVLASDALSANAWSIVFFAVGCDSALALAARAGGRLGVVCADSSGARWTPDLAQRVSVLETLRLEQPARAP